MLVAHGHGGGGLTWIDRSILVLDDSEHPEAGDHDDADQLQPDAQPLHGGVAQEQAALVLLQTPGDLLLEPATTKRVGDAVKRWF